MSEDVREQEWTPSCYECGRETARRNLQDVPVHIDHDDDGGYDRVPVPMCPRCRRERLGWDCPHCGLTHDTEDSAMFCCRRRPGDAPDCLECGRRMTRISWGYHADGRPTCEVAECESCGVFWGKYTGWENPEEASDG